MCVNSSAFSAKHPPLYPENAVILAPLAGYTDIPYRRSMRRHGCRFAFTEMVDAESLLYATRKSLYYIEPDSPGEWLGVQLVSNSPTALEKAVGMLPEGQFNAIDFNLGCPAPKVAKKGEGAVLARRNPDLALCCLDVLVKAAGNTPVTVKTRILSEEDLSVTIAFAKRLEETGIQALTLHGRIMEKFYSGPVFSEIISAVRESLSIPVIANGGVMALGSFRELKTQTGCSQVMVARGTQGNPWLFAELAQGEAFLPPTLNELITEIRLYLDDMQQYYGIELGLKIARKTVLDFLRGRGFSGELRNRIAHLVTPSDISVLLNELSQGPADSYWYWLTQNPLAPRRLRKE